MFTVTNNEKLENDIMNEIDRLIARNKVKQNDTVNLKDLLYKRYEYDMTPQQAMNYFDYCFDNSDNIKKIQWILSAVFAQLPFVKGNSNQQNNRQLDFINLLSQSRHFKKINFIEVQSVLYTRWREAYNKQYPSSIGTQTETKVIDSDDDLISKQEINNFKNKSLK